MNVQRRISPTSASRRILALDFIRRYFDEHGESPSFGEIAAALDTDVPTVSRIVRRLDGDGDIVHIPGARRGIRLPDSVDEIATHEALLVLRRRGWVVNDDTSAPKIIVPPVINSQLPIPPELNDIP